MLHNLHKLVLVLFCAAAVMPRNLPASVSLSLSRTNDYVFTDVASTNLCGQGIGTNIETGVAYPLRFEDVAFCFEAAEERYRTSNSNIDIDDSDGRLTFQKTDRKVSLLPNVDDNIHIYQSIYVPIETGDFHLLSDELAALAVNQFTNVSINGSYTIPIATNDYWLGFIRFWPHPVASNYFRRVIAATNVATYIYANLAAATHMKYLRYGYAAAHSNRYVNATPINYSWTYTDQNGWRRHDSPPESYDGYNHVPAGRIDLNDTYRYYHQITKRTTEAWNTNLVYQGYQHSGREYVWRSDDIQLAVTNYLSLTNAQAATALTHVGVVVDYAHTRQISDADNGVTNRVYGSGRYYYPLSPSAYTISGHTLTATLSYDQIARDICTRLGHEAHPSTSGPSMSAEIDYPRPLADRNREWERSSTVTDDLTLKLRYFTGIVRMRWNARLSNP